MKKHFTFIQIQLLVLVLVFGNACNGQVINNPPAKSTSNQTKLIKNHFTNQYQALADNVHCGLQDKAGNLWFGKRATNLYLYNRNTITQYSE